MKILHFLDYMRLELGGVVRAVLDLCGGMASRGHEVLLATLEDKDVPAHWRQGGSGQPRCVRLDRVDRSGIERLVRGVDVVHLHGMWTMQNLVFARAARRLGVPYVVSPHGMLDEWSMRQGGAKKRLFLKVFGRSLLENAVAVHCTAQMELEQAKRWFRGTQGVVAPLLLDLSPFSPLPGPELARAKFPFLVGGDAVILFLSRLHHKKGPDVLIEAGALLRERGVSSTLVLAGPCDPDYQSELNSLVQANRMQSSVHLVGLVSGKEKVSLFQAANVFALPTSQENFGFVLYESLAAGTPLVTTRHVDTWAELEASGGARTCERTPAAFADSLEVLLRDRWMLTEMGTRGRAWALQQFTPDEILRVYEAMYSRAPQHEGAAVR